MIDGEALVFWKNIFITPAGSGQETDARVIGALNVLSNLRHSKQFAQDVSYVPASSYVDVLHLSVHRSAWWAAVSVT